MRRTAKQELLENSDSDSDDHPKAAFGVSAEDFADEDVLFRNPGARRKKLTKEQATYGIWADDSDDDNNVISHNKPSYNTGVSFVKSSTTLQPDESSDSSESNDDKSEENNDDGQEKDVDDDVKMSDASEEEEDEYRPQFGGSSTSIEVDYRDERPQFGGLGLGFAASTTVKPERPIIGAKETINSKNADISLEQLKNIQFSSSRERFTRSKKTNESKDTRKTNVNLDKSFGKWETTTKGFGSRYLQQFGYVAGQGLGKDGGGLTKPIDVKLRPSKMGLGHGGFDEMSETVKAEKSKQKKLAGEQDDENIDIGKEKKPTSGGWRKSKKKPKQVYKTAEEFMKEEEERLGTTYSAPRSTTIQTKIIDMTGKETKILDNISQLNSQRFSVLDTSKRLPELRHNIRLLADIAQGDLTEVHAGVLREETKIRELTLQISKVEIAASESKSRVERVTALIEIAKECEFISQSILSSITKRKIEDPNDVFQPFQPILLKFQNEFQQEFKDFALDNLVVAVIAPI
ncbi:Tuftelin-interacting protein 11, partial [Nowakowskiella sp. JEL0078]